MKFGKDDILFDSGQSGEMIWNADRLGADLNRVDVAVLSHGHFDHSGGFLHFLEVNDRALIYMNRGVFGKRLNRNGKAIGISDWLGETVGIKRRIPSVEIRLKNGTM